MNRTQQRTVGPVLASMVVAATFGCTSDQGGSGEESVNAASPAETTWMDKHARFNAAIEGVSFENGVVTATEPLPGNVDEATELRAEGVAHYDEGRYIDATAAHVRAIRMAPEYADAYVSLGDAVLAHGKVDFAAAAYRTAVSLNDLLVEAHYKLAHALWMMSDKEAAVLEMEQVVELDAAHAAAHERLAIWNYYSGDDAAAWRHVNAARALGHEVPPQFLALLEARSPAGNTAGQ